MKRLLYLCLIFITQIVGQTGMVKAGNDTIKMSQLNHGKTFNKCSVIFTDASSTGNYQDGKNLTTTICSQRSSIPGQPPLRMEMTVESFILSRGDTLRIYEGRAIDSQHLMSVNNKTAFTSLDLPIGTKLHTSVMDTSGCMTFHFVSNDDNQTAEGWQFLMQCKSRCPFPKVELEENFTKFSPNGIRVERPVRYKTDTVYATGANGETDSSQRTIYPYAEIGICEADSIAIALNVTYPESSPDHQQSHNIMTFTWNYGDGTVDTITGAVGLIGHKKWNKVEGYDLVVSVRDTVKNCAEELMPVRIKISANPINGVADLPDVCSFDSLNIITGNDPNSVIRTDPVKKPTQARKVYANRVFIPDGPRCATLCYEAPVTFTEFRPGERLTRTGDFLAVCVNMEHSYTSDIWINLICPNQSLLELKYFDRSAGGGATFLGLPLDGNPYDGSSLCDSNQNPPGAGFTYCWSEVYDNSRGELETAGLSTTDWEIYYNAATGVTTGRPRGSSNPVQGTRIYEHRVVDSTQWEDDGPHTNYFRPHQSFAGLLGCPLNGEWKLQVCDDFGIDNGWVFSWWLDLKQTSASAWDYQVAIDTVKWDGINLVATSDTTCRIAPATPGDLTYRITIVDEYGCEWDTVTHIHVVKTPIVDLGEDISLCESSSFVLDAGNDGAYAYVWAPTGETTKTITVTPSQNTGQDKLYAVQVTNTNGHIYCYGVDSIVVGVFRDPTASFVPSISPLEGCEPLTFTLNNTASFADTYYWKVANQTSTDPNPTFTLNRGMHDVSLVVTTKDGCRDSVSYEKLVNVFSVPKAEFSWNPTNPYSSKPTVNFVNQTDPHYEGFSQYAWHIQTLQEQPDLRQTLTGFQPSFTWPKQSGTSISGDYLITLDAFTKTVAPSGHVYECHDTITHKITIINDNLLFPNVITANNDGINDVFTIRNLVIGQAFPDNELTIVDRWGREVFFRQDIRNEEDFWNPVTTDSPSGTYFYHFEGRGPLGEVEYNGAVEVIR